MEFRCRLGTAAGEVIEGVYVADNESRLRHDLEEKGLFVLELHPKGALGLGGLSLALPRRRTIATREFLVFNQELATLLKAGMPLVQSLDLLRLRVLNPVFRGVLDDVYEKVKAGTSLSEAFEVHSELFPSVYTASLLAGERSGNLDSVLRRYVSYTKIIATIRRKTLSALVYPMILVSLSIVLVGIIVLKVVPAFSEFYASFGSQLPLATRVIVRVSDIIRREFLLLVGGLVAAVVACLVWLKRPGRKAQLDHLLLRVPVLGPIAAKFATSQLARTLATLLGGGLPLVNALEISARSIGNRYVAQQLDVVGQQVREGQSFAAALEARKVFPEVSVKMAEVGESTGALQDMLNNVADFFDEEIDTNMERFITLVEPVLLVAMGIVIAGLLLALYMPLFQLSSVLGH
ncbi:MAG: type II secretion system F family protein [Acidobacteriota bacterium]|nr:type II secretion system F family protein [Acidobacteriota bacterium]